MFIEEKNMIRLTDTDGIQFDLDINVVDGIVGSNSADNAGSVVHIAGGETIAVKETAVEVMQKIVKVKMCKEYRQSPFHPDSPNAEPERPIYFCDGCGKGIYDEDDYYPIFDERYCVDCMEGQ